MLTICLALADAEVVFNFPISDLRFGLGAPQGRLPSAEDPAYQANTVIAAATLCRVMASLFRR